MLTRMLKRTYAGQGPYLVRLLKIGFIRRIAQRLFSPSLKLQRNVNEIRKLQDSFSSATITVSKEGSYFIMSNGLKFFLDQYTRGIALYDSCAEQAASEFLAKRVKKGLFVDVGANLGWYTMLMAHQGVRVCSFEPSPLALDVLKKNVRLNGFSDLVEVFPLALSEKDGRSKMQFVGFGTSRLSKTVSSSTKMVRTARLDSVLKDRTQKVTCIKIDIEGAELLMLKGAVGVLTRDRPDLLIEIEEKHALKFGTKAKDVFEFLSANKYTCTHVFAPAKAYAFSGSVEQNLRKGNNFYFVSQ